MFSAIPIWLLPVWTLDVSLLWAIVDSSRMPKASGNSLARTDSGVVRCSIELARA